MIVPDLKPKYSIPITPDRVEILKKAKEYLSHPDEWVRILAQIAIYHAGDK